MSKTIGTVKKAYRQSPIRLAFLLLALLMLAIFWLTTNKKPADVEVKDLIVKLLSSMAWVFLLILSLATLGTTLLARTVFSLKISRVSLQFLNPRDLKVRVPRLSIPFLGRIYMQLAFADGSYSEVFALRSKNSIDPRLMDIRAYNTLRIIFIFEDMLGLSRLTKTIPLSETLLNAPKYITMDEVKSNPSKSSDEEIRSSNVSYEPGEWLRYKSYESGDDLRRIVWKVYAKNRELMVRTQELQTIYATTITIYAALDSANAQQLKDVRIAREWLNFFKNTSYTVFQKLKQETSEVKFGIYGNKELQRAEADVSSLLTQSSWQAANSQESLPAGSMVIFHSWCGIAWLETTLETSSPGSQFMYVQLSKASTELPKASLLQHLFLRPIKAHPDSLEDKLLGFQLLQQEAALETIINKYDNVVRL